MKKLEEIFTYFQNLKIYREYHKLTQADIGRILGMTRQEYGRYERGKRDLPIKHFITLARFYGVTVDDLLFIK